MFSIIGHQLWMLGEKTYSFTCYNMKERVIFIKLSVSKMIFYLCFDAHTVKWSIMRIRYKTILPLEEYLLIIYYGSSPVSFVLMCSTMLPTHIQGFSMFTSCGWNLTKPPQPGVPILPHHHALRETLRKVENQSWAAVFSVCIKKGNLKQKTETPNAPVHQSGIVFTFPTKYLTTERSL